MKLYLVTSQDKNIIYGDSLYVDGIFSSRELADIWISEHPEVGYQDITEMTLDHPENETDGYPGVYYEE
ncbi:hypothetical protein [Leuconostoc mesenteroides]|uniref:hypothetical protein n=1 Tax=Leuconostoc mesenteroides TaxID=1245 RepID=UPI001CBCDAE5|nr:hypothetical protein [Leuconostoc mesenteroides]MBZ1530701.1 hypothetical protein [Leuconostoc mesenteroides]